jgi:hypothetical protein
VGNNRVGMSRKERSSKIYEKFLKLHREVESVYSWKSGKNDLLKIELRLKSVSKSKKEAVFIPFPTSLHILQDLVSGIGKLNFYIPSLSEYFSVDIVNFKENMEITIKLPEKMYFYERRKNERFHLVSPLIIRTKSFAGNEGPIVKNSYDISLDGTSIVLPTSEKTGWRVNQVIEEFSIIYNGTKVDTAVKICNIKKIGPYLLEGHPYGGVKYSFQFTKKDQNFKSLINTIIKGHLKIDQTQN